MRKRGYQPAKSHKDIAPVLAECKALTDLEMELQKRIASLPERRITRAELVRDLGYTRSGLRVFGRMKLLAPEPDSDRRKTYSLREALVIRTRFGGYASASRLRVVRKHANVTTVAKDAARRALKLR
jgi:hypothetical protein